MSFGNHFITNSVVFEQVYGRWGTHLPDPSKKSGRKLVKKTKLDDLENAIVKFYRDNDKISQPTLRKVYPLWIKYYALRVEAIGSVKRVIAEWNKYYENSNIVDIPLDKLDKITIESWLLELIRTNQQNRKQYYNSSLPFRQMMQYCLDKKIIYENPFSEISINPKIFRKQKKPESSTQVYRDPEEVFIMKLAWEEWMEDKELGACLALILMFYTGLRIGEVVAFKASDLNGDYITVNRMEREIYHYVDATTLVQAGHEVVGHAKTSAGYRDVYLTEGGKEVIAAVLKYMRPSLPGDFWLFTNHGERCNADSVNYRLKKYCNILGIPFRSPHKVRKTYVSRLIDGGVNINAIREQVGHEDEKTTYNCYCFDRNTKEETGKQIENALATVHY